MPLTSISIKNKREEIISSVLREKYISSKNEIRVTPKLVERLFVLYDDIFFGGEIRQKLRDKNSTLDFKISRKSQRIAGFCSKKGCSYFLTFNADMYHNMFKNPKDRSLRVNGLLCYSQLECLMFVLEHEMVHLMMFVWGYDKKGTGKYSAHGALFQCMTKNLFGHTSFRHNFNQGDGESLLNKSDVHVGMKVEFTLKKKSVQGVVTKMNKVKARVTIDNGAIYNVPYTVMRKA